MRVLPMRGNLQHAKFTRVLTPGASTRKARVQATLNVTQQGTVY